jgi:hypothetical protein
MERTIKVETLPFVEHEGGFLISDRLDQGGILKKPSLA